MDAPIIVEPSKAVGKIAEAYTLSLKTLRDIFGIDAKATLRNAEAEAKAQLIKGTAEMKLKQAQLLHGFLMKEAHSYLFHQKNLDAVLQIAAPSLEDVGAENLSESFRQRFSDAAQDATEDEMRELWGRILVQEAKKPNTVSRRTIEMMKSFSKDDALLILKLAPYALNLGNHVVVADITDIKDGEKPKYDFTLEDIIQLDAIGILKHSTGLQLQFQPKGAIFIQYGLVKILGTSETMVSLASFPLTSTGREIVGVIEYEANYTYIQDVVKRLESGGTFFADLSNSNVIELKKKPEPTVDQSQSDKAVA